MGKKKPGFYVSFDDQEMKDAIDQYAKRRGFRGGPDFARVAIYEWIHRKKLKADETVLHEKLGGIL